MAGRSGPTAPDAAYEWDEENRLVAVTSGTKRTQIVYDGFGRWVIMRDVVGGTGLPERRFTWSGERSVVELMTDGVTGQYTSYYDEGCYDSYYNRYRHFFRDHLGSVHDTIDDQQGGVVQSINFDPYGRRTVVLDHYSLTNANLQLGPHLGLGGFYVHPQHTLAFATYQPGYLSRGQLPCWLPSRSQAQAQDECLEPGQTSQG